MEPTLQFTTGIEQNDSIHFLDLKISKLNIRHEFAIFHKHPHIDPKIHNTSVNPFRQKTTAYKGFTHRLTHISLLAVIYNLELNVIIWQWPSRTQ